MGSIVNTFWHFQDVVVVSILISNLKKNDPIGIDPKFNRLHLKEVTKIECTTFWYENIEILI